MNKKQLFKKYNIDESHNKWESIDTWVSLEIYRLMKGEMPKEKDFSTRWAADFLDEFKEKSQWLRENVLIRKDMGSLFLTAKRMVYHFADEIIEEKYNK